MIIFQSLPQIKRQTIREEVLRMYAETDVSYGEIAEVNRFRFFLGSHGIFCVRTFFIRIYRSSLMLLTGYFITFYSKSKCISKKYLTFANYLMVKCL